MASQRKHWLHAAHGLARDTATAIHAHHMPLVAAGCAFWATLALFPALSALVSVYGLLFNPRNVVTHLDVLSSLLPADLYVLIAARLRVLVLHHAPMLGTSLVVSGLMTFWITANAMKSILAALNVAYRETERRGFLRFNLVALAMTLGAILTATVTMSLLVALPPLLHLIGLTAGRRAMIHGLSIAVLLLTVAASLLVLYRFGPSRPGGRWHLATPGTALATLLWLAASEVLSWYVGNVAPAHATYGPLAAAAGALMWFYVTAYVVLLGAELNAQIEERVRVARALAKRLGTEAF